MMKRTCLFVVFGALLSIVTLGGELPVVLQPNSTSYSSPQLAILNRVIADLDGRMNDRSLGVQRAFPNEWGSAQFAAYTAGILDGMGYETTLVSGAGWPEGVHTWVLVQVNLDGQVGWIPVEACPEQGHTQQILGTIPLAYDASGGRLFDSRYLGFDRVVELPPNAPPVAKIRPQALGATVVDSIQFLAIGSYDPDGEIVLCRWEFGDGRSQTSTGWSVYHQYLEAGSYSARLTVIDDRGTKSVTESIMLRIVGAGEATSPGGGCGCGT